MKGISPVYLLNRRFPLIVATPYTVRLSAYVEAPHSTPYTCTDKTVIDPCNTDRNHTEAATNLTE